MVVSTSSFTVDESADGEVEVDLDLNVDAPPRSMNAAAVLLGPSDDDDDDEEDCCDCFNSLVKAVGEDGEE